MHSSMAYLNLGQDVAKKEKEKDHIVAKSNLL